jgi:glycosyltransferase involved in cell wall biosynthesis
VRERADFLARRRIHVLVVGNIIREPMRLPGFTATGRVEVVEPYFAAADAALNPMWSGAGTNVKMCEFIATRLPILTTPFGARGFAIDDGRTGFLFERDTLEAVMAHVRARLDDDPDGLRALAAAAYAENEGAIDMYACVRGLVQAIAEGRPGAPGTAPTAG